MNQLNNNNPLFESLNNNKSKDRANVVFLKLLAQQKKAHNPFDVTRSNTPKSNSNTIKPGGTINGII